MRRHTDMLRSIHDQISPSLSALKSLSENSTMTRLIDDAKRQQDMMRSVLGPIEDLRRMGLLELSRPCCGSQRLSGIPEPFPLA